MHGATAIRPKAVALAAISALPMVALYAYLLAAFLFPQLLRLFLSRGAFYVTFYGIAAMIVVAAAMRGPLARRLPPDEQAFVRFWARAPYLTLLIAAALAALPLLIEYAAAQQLGWSPGTQALVVRGIIVVVIVLSVLFVRVLWQRQQTSTPPRAT